MGVADQRHTPAALPRGKRPEINCTAALVDPSACLNAGGKFAPIGAACCRC